MKTNAKILHLILIAFVFCAANLSAGDEAEWRPISETELSLSKPLVEADADAEAIFWEVTFDDKKRSKMSLYHYVRVKIFTERGRERFSKFDIPFAKGKKVEDVAARVIKPDGTIVNLNPSDVFEREIVKAGKLKIKARSFAVPGIEPGVIVEYRYTEIYKNDSVSGERLVFQRDIPMQRVSYFVRPYKGNVLTPTFYNMPEGKFVDDRTQKGFLVASLKNVPALREESYMPPEDEVRQWAYLSYNDSSFSTWLGFSMITGRFFKDMIEPDKHIERKAEELTAGARSDLEKLERIYEFVQKEIKNVTFDRTLSEEESDKLKIKDAGDVLKKGLGTASLIDLLFASLAKAAGFRPYLLFSPDRSEQFFTPEKYANPAFLHPAGIGLKIGHDWKFFNPGAPYLPFGKLVWFEEDTTALLSDFTGYAWQKIPLTTADESLAERKGKFTLDEEGTLSGAVEIKYSGHQAVNRRRDGFADSDAKRVENFKNELKELIETAEISNFQIENFLEHGKPLVYKFDLRVPNYAQKTGKRLFFQPGVFEYGTKPAFSAAERTHKIYFPFPWSEKDEITIKLPAGFALDNADAPGDAADPSNIGSLKINIGINEAAHELVYKRKFHFGGGGKILFPAEVYQPMKNLFDIFHKANTHAITLKKQ